MLENGPSSRYASYFDIDWDPPERKLTAHVLMPVLGDHYGRVLEAGELTVERRGGSFVVRYHEHEAPLSPRTLDDLLGRAAERAGQASPAGSAELAQLAEAHGELPHAILTDPVTVAERHDGKEKLRERLTALCASRPGCSRRHRRRGGRGQRRPRRARRAARPAELPACLLGHRRRGAVIPPVLQHREPGRPADGGPRGLRRHPPPDPGAGPGGLGPSPGRSS